MGVRKRDTLSWIFLPLKCGSKLHLKWALIAVPFSCWEKYLGQNIRGTNVIYLAVFEYFIFVAN